MTVDEMTAAREKIPAYHDYPEALNPEALAMTALVKQVQQEDETEMERPDCP